MAVLPPTLDLSISLPGSSGESGEGRAMRNLDINQVPEVEPDEDEGASSPPRKKLRLSKDQSRQLEESFRRNQTLNPKRKEELAMELKLKARQVEVWFQNRRARSKLKKTEMECEYLKRWFGSLTERNRRLQNEVERLRALRSVGPTDANSQLASASMCPRCERVISNPVASSSTSVSHVTTSLEASENLLPASTTTTTRHQQTSSAAC